MPRGGGGGFHGGGGGFHSGGGGFHGGGGARAPVSHTTIHTGPTIIPTRGSGYHGGYHGGYYGHPRYGYGYGGYYPGFYGGVGLPLLALSTGALAGAALASPYGYGGPSTTENVQNVSVLPSDDNVYPDALAYPNDLVYQNYGRYENDEDDEDWIDEEEGDYDE